MTDWRNISPGHISRDPELFRQFKIDFLNVVGTTFDTGCGSCFERQYEQFYNKLYIMETPRKTEYKLKLMYNGIQFNGKIYNNNDLTDKDAKELLKSHPAGEQLFDFIPKDTSPEKPIEVVEAPTVEEVQPKKAKK